MRFLDLRLKFEPAEKGCWTVYIIGPKPSVIRSSPSGEMNFVLPFDVGQLQYWRGRIKDNVGNGNGLELQVYRVGTPPNVEYLSRPGDPLDLTKALGEDLFRALFEANTSDAYSIYRLSRDRAIREGRGLRIWLFLPRDDVLDRLPFEYLYDPWDESGGYLVRRTDISISIVRAVRVQREAKRTPQGSLRLWYVSASPTLQSPINDFNIISSACWETGLKVTPHPTLQASPGSLSNMLGRMGSDTRYSPTIIHVSAHGATNRIFMVQPSGGTHPILAPALASQFAQVKELHLVVFSVCDMDAPVECAMELCRQGISVILMQFPATEHAVKSFQRAFYTNYFLDYDLDRAVTEGRRQIRLEIAGTMEWGTPVAIVPEFSSPPLLLRLRHCVTSVMRWFARVLIPGWIRFLIMAVILSLFAITAYVFRQSQALPPAIQQVVVYAEGAVFRAPDSGRLLSIPIRGEDGTVPMEVFATQENKPLDFTCKVIGEGKVENKSAVGHSAQFEYKPPLTSTVTTLEFCVYARDRDTVKSCMAIVLDIIITH